MNETGLSTFSIPIQYYFGIPNQSNKKRAKNKRNSNREGEVKLSLVADDMILYIRDHKNYQKIIRNHKLFQQSSRIEN
jgi:hypothetical protein